MYRQQWWLAASAMWVAQFVVLVTANMLNFALIWQLSSQRDAAVALSIAGAISLAPSILLAPVIGWVVDRYTRRSIMIVAELISLLPLWLIWQWHSTALVGVIYVVVVLRAVSTAFYTTAWQATWPQLIPARHLQRLSSMPQIILGAASLLTPICGASIVTSQQWGWALLAALLAVVISIVVAWVCTPVTAYRHEDGRWWQDWHSVWQEFTTTSGLVGVLVVAVLLNATVMPVFSLLPYLVSNHVQGGAWVLATSEIVGGIGLVCGVVVLTWWGGFPQVIHTLFAAVLLLAVAFGLLALLPAHPYVLYLFVGLLGWAGAWMHGPLLTLFQINLPAHTYGRAMALLNGAMNTATPLGILAAGYLVAWWGVSTWAWAVMIVIVLIVIVVSNSAIMRLRGLPRTTSHEETVARRV
jgi:DHA3 family macrolide efflux protein-like MFS transporter